MPEALDAKRTHLFRENASADWSRRVLNGSPCISSAYIAYVHVDFVWFKAHLCRQHCTYTYEHMANHYDYTHSIPQTPVTRTKLARYVAQLDRHSGAPHFRFDKLHTHKYSTTTYRSSICSNYLRNAISGKPMCSKILFAASFIAQVFCVHQCGATSFPSSPPLLIQFVAVVSTVFVIVVVVVDGVFCGWR